jgi:hypothetical protein
VTPEQNSCAPNISASPTFERISSCGAQLFTIWLAKSLRGHENHNIIFANSPSPRTVASPDINHLLTKRAYDFAGATTMTEVSEAMADQNEAKTRTIGYLPIEKVQTLQGWNEYLEKSTQLSSLRIETQRAKNSVRDALRQRLNEECEIDFVADGDRVRVYRVFRKQQQGRRTRSLDLSSSFREEPLDGTPETNGLPFDAPANLDPVTERLTALIRQKMVR